MATKRPVWDESITHGTPLSTALQELISHYNQVGEYKPKTADQLKEQAAGEYKTYYDQQRLGAQQAYDRTNLALQQQLEGIGRSYDKAREASAKEYNNAYSQADRALLSRGMQRSSYGMQSLGNLAQKGLEAQQDIWDQQVQAEGNIQAQQSQLASQLADQIRQYNTSEQDQIMARIRELEDQEYQRGQTNQQYRNQLSTQIYEYLRENNSGSGGSYSGATGDPDNQNPGNNPGSEPANPGMSDADILGALDDVPRAGNPARPNAGIAVDYDDGAAQLRTRKNLAAPRESGPVAATASDPKLATYRANQTPETEEQKAARIAKAGAKSQAIMTTNKQNSLEYWLNLASSGDPTAQQIMYRYYQLQK